MRMPIYKSAWQLPCSPDSLLRRRKTAEKSGEVIKRI